jgi:hypothetical protein
MDATPVYREKKWWLSTETFGDKTYIKTGGGVG